MTAVVIRAYAVMSTDRVILVTTRVRTAVWDLPFPDSSHQRRARVCYVDLVCTAEVLPQDMGSGRAGLSKLAALVAAKCDPARQSEQREPVEAGLPPQHAAGHSYTCPDGGAPALAVHEVVLPHVWGNLVPTDPLSACYHPCCRRWCCQMI